MGCLAYVRQQYVSNTSAMLAHQCTAATSPVVDLVTPCITSLAVVYPLVWSWRPTWAGYEQDYALAG